MNLNEFGQAKNDLDKALTVDPTNKELKAAMITVKKRARMYKEKLREMNEEADRAAAQADLSDATHYQVHSTEEKGASPDS